MEAVVCPDSDRMTELSARITSGKFAVYIVRVLTNAMYQVAALQPITNCGYDFSDDIWWQKMMKDFTFNGKTYATNIRPKNTVNAGTRLCCITTNAPCGRRIWRIRIRCGRKVPSQWTWKKLLSMRRDVQHRQYVKKKNDYAGMALAYNNSYVRMFGCANYDYNADTGKWENYWTIPSCRNAGRNS